jgi:transposase
MESEFFLESRLIGGLPLVNEIIERIGIDRLLLRALPRGPKLHPAKSLGVLLRNIVLNDRQPIYSHQEWARRVEPELVGLEPGEEELLNDDRVGRALDRLFDADRASLLTEVVIRTIREYRIDLNQLHNDSTTLTLSGDYEKAKGKTVRGKPTLKVTYGHNKDHRPDLKQLLFVLTVSADGAVPIHYRAMDGNTEDSTTHLATWEMLRQLTGMTDFLYVADCKLCTGEIMSHIDREKGRFITVLPRNRKEDGWFREYLQNNNPPWEEAIRRPNPRRRKSAEDVWKVVEAPLSSKEGYRIVWVWNSAMAERDADARQSRIEKAWIEMERFETRLRGKRCRFHSRHQVEKEAEKIIEATGAERWVEFQVRKSREPVYRQASKGRPGEKSLYLRRHRTRFSVSIRKIDEIVLEDARSDGIFPLITNVRNLSKKEILEAYKSQPRLEKRHEQLKSVQHLAPVWLKNVARIEALLFLYFIALLVHALLEREIRKGMTREGLDMIPLYPEERECRSPSTERILDVFAPLQRHRLRSGQSLIKVFDPELNTLQLQIMNLLGMRNSAFRLNSE